MTGAKDGGGPGPTGPPHQTWGIPPPPPHNGFGITALIVGIVGVLTGMIPLLFWIAAVLGVIAIVFGILGYQRARQGFATNGRMSLTGSVLGGVAIVLAVVGALIIADVFEDIERELGPTRTTAPATPGTTPPEETTATATAVPGALAFGETQRYEDGVEVRVSEPSEFSPSDTAAGHSPGNVAVAVEVMVTNGADESLDLVLVQVQAKDAEGRTADRIFDSAQDLQDLSGTLLPGKSSVGSYAFDLPSDAAGSLDVEVRPGFTYDSAIWSGTAP
ncbi:DUF4190 domain-containing protein [Streptomyces sp. PR69]|uniref:DUF4190 domain-containing protein n=1 Tax=Streptomyces sp. PR69 TaxID=2984950 RepID=UPI0022645870|nr:DUF4190 domain-containing protein [Streptomyces sp. PR69]